MSNAGVGPLCFLKTNVTDCLSSEKRTFRLPRNFGALKRPSADQLFKDADFIFQLDLAPAHTTKSTKNVLNDYSAGVLDWPAKSPYLNPHREFMVYCQEENEKQETKKMQMSWRPLSKKPGLPYQLSSATNWSPPCHAELRQWLKQKEPLPSIEYIYNKWTYFPEGQQFTKNVFLLGLWSILIWAKIITIKRTKDFNYFSLCALDWINTRVSKL